MNKRTFCFAAIIAVLALGVSGCGSSGLTPPAVIAPSARITRATENTFSESARILAARDAARNGDTWLSADAARVIDADLQAIRRAYPQVQNITAFPDYDLHKILVAVPATAPFLQNWLAGNVATGEPALDALLTEFAPESVTTLGAPIEGGTAYFTLRFGQSLNIPKLAERISAASRTIIAADADGIIGDGDNIVRGDAAGQYIFSEGSGDCPAGCINRHSYTFAISGDGTVTLLREEDNTPGTNAPQ